MIKNVIKRFLDSESATEVVEWAILAGLLTIMGVAAWPIIGEAIKSRLNALLAAIT